LGVYVFEMFPKIFYRADDQLSIYEMEAVLCFKLDLNFSLREERMEVIIKWILDFSVHPLVEFDSNKKDPNITVEVSRKAVTYSPTVWQYHLR
tara:strand:- start:27 stop:305 length:279 start_codon:yes stop_codon:yes gene_type:complete